jgi:protein gp37
MGIGTKIPYAHNTVTTAIGCLPVSPGCANCFAECLVGGRLAFNPRLDRYHGVTEITGDRPRWNGKVNLAPELLGTMVRRERPEVWFIGDLSDLFYEEVPTEHIIEVLAYVLVAGRRGQVAITTTKRSRRQRDLVNGMDLDLLARFADRIASGLLARRPRRAGWEVRHVPGLAAPEPDQHAKVERRPLPWPLPNWWPGVSAEDQRRADERIADLAATPAVLRWVSFEPLLGPVEVCNGRANRWSVPTRRDAAGNGIEWTDPGPAFIPVDWVVVGGESGRHARVNDLAWPRALRDQCRAAGVPFFHKQAGACVRVPRGDALQFALDGSWTAESPGAAQGIARPGHPKGADPREWPPDLRIREFPARLPRAMWPTVLEAP